MSVSRVPRVCSLVLRQSNSTRERFVNRSVERAGHLQSYTHMALPAHTGSTSTASTLPQNSHGPAAAAMEKERDAPLRHGPMAAPARKGRARHAGGHWPTASETPTRPAVATMDRADETRALKSQEATATDSQKGEHLSRGTPSDHAGPNRDRPPANGSICRGGPPTTGRSETSVATHSTQLHSRSSSGLDGLDGVDGGDRLDG